MKRLALAFGFLILAGCEAERFLDRAVEIKDEMCACEDAKCTKEVSKKFDNLLKTNKNVKGSEDQAKKAKEIVDGYTQCMVKALRSPK